MKITSVSGKPFFKSLCFTLHLVLGTSLQTSLVTNPAVSLTQILLLMVTQLALSSVELYCRYLVSQTETKMIIIISR
jgi:hypothetical protein